MIRKKQHLRYYNDNLKLHFRPIFSDLLMTPPLNVDIELVLNFKVWASLINSDYNQTEPEPGSISSGPEDIQLNFLQPRDDLETTRRRLLLTSWPGPEQRNNIFKRWPEDNREK